MQSGVILVSGAAKTVSLECIVLIHLTGNTFPVSHCCIIMDELATFLADTARKMHLETWPFLIHVIESILRFLTKDKAQCI